MPSDHAASVPHLCFGIVVVCLSDFAALSTLVRRHRPSSQIDFGRHCFFGSGEDWVEREQSHGGAFTSEIGPNVFAWCTCAVLQWQTSWCGGWPEMLIFVSVFFETCQGSRQIHDQVEARDPNVPKVCLAAESHAIFPARMLSRRDFFVCSGPNELNDERRFFLLRRSRLIAFTVVCQTGSDRVGAIRLRPAVLTELHQTDAGKSGVFIEMRAG